MSDLETSQFLLRQFNLTTMAQELEVVQQKSQSEGWSFGRSLRELLEMESYARDTRRLERLLKDSGLPEGKSLASLDTRELSTANRRRLSELCEGHFTERAVNVLAFGLPGRGKTHFLSAIGYELIQRQRKRVLFTPSYRLIQRLLTAKQELRLDAELNKLLRYEVIILDDLGYVKQSREEMEVLFTFFAERYERGSVMISSNLVFSKWDQIFQDPMTAMAAVDRLVHHSVLLEFDGKSHRAQKGSKSKEEAVDQELQATQNNQGK